jgi:hypothetical protein
MLYLTMDCYYRSSHGGPAVLRDRLKIKAAGRSMAIEEAHRQAEFLRTTYFELRDPSQTDSLVYSSNPDARHVPGVFSGLPCSIPGPAMVPAGFSVPETPTLAPGFKSLGDFQRWFAAEIKAHKRKPYPLLEALMKGQAARTKTLPGRGAGAASARSSGSGKTAPRVRSRKRNSPQSGPAPDALPSS